MKYQIFFILCLVPLLFGCGIYSFSGVSLSPDIKSISIINFTTSGVGGPSSLTFKWNEKLKEYFQRNTRLTFIPNNGDLQLEGSISGYDVTPVATTANDQAAFNRLTITIQVKYTNNKDEEKNFERPFSFYADFPQSQTLKQKEDELIKLIFDRIAQDVFNATAADW